MQSAFSGPLGAALSRLLNMSAAAGALICAVVLLRLALMTAGLVLFKHIPAMIRLVLRTEPRLSLKEDITYKLDE